MESEAFFEQRVSITAQDQNQIGKITDQGEKITIDKILLDKIRHELESKCSFDLSLDQRIKNIESAIAFTKLAKSRPNGQVLKKQADEYFLNELLEIEMMCKEEWFAYLNRIYFKGGLSTFYK